MATLIAVAAVATVIVIAPVVVVVVIAVVSPTPMALAAFTREHLANLVADHILDSAARFVATTTHCPAHNRGHKGSILLVPRPLLARLSGGIILAGAIVELLGGNVGSLALLARAVEIVCRHLIGGFAKKKGEFRSERSGLYICCNLRGRRYVGRGCMFSGQLGPARKGVIMATMGKVSQGKVRVEKF